MPSINKPESFLLRNGLLAFSLVLAASIAYTGLAGVQGLVLAGILAIAMMIMAAFGQSVLPGSELILPLSIKVTR
jgi:hypothetical protein